MYLTTVQIAIDDQHRMQLKFPTRLRQSLRALYSRNYRLFFIGQGLSLVGSWMTQIASIWLVYDLTHSTLLLGIVAVITQSPSFTLAPMAGFLADRWNRHHILLGTQSLAMIRSLALAALTLTHHIHIWHLVALGLVQGMIMALDMPTRQAFLPEMVNNKEDLSNAIALNSSLVSSARLMGPAIAGLLIAMAGAGVCFLVDGISYIAVIAALLAMKITPKVNHSRSTKSPWQDMKAGFRYALHSLPIRSVLLLLALVNFMGTPFVALGPAFARDVLHGGSDTFGLLMTTSAIGALAGAIYLGSRTGIVGLEKLLMIAPIALGIGLIVFSQSHILWFSLAIIMLLGCLLVIQNAASNTIVQAIVDDEKRGRVMGLYIITTEAMIPFGNLFAGGLATQIGMLNTLLVEGSFCLLGSYLFLRVMPKLRQSLVAAQKAM